MKKEFRDIYYKIYNENEIANIEKLSSKNLLSLLKIFGIMIIGALVLPQTLVITLPVFIIYGIKTTSGKQMEKQQEYMNLYKEKLILPVFQELFEDVQYKPDEGMQLNEYLKAEYEDIYINNIEEYSSNDHIIFPMQIEGKYIGNLDIYDVKLQREGSGKDNSKIRIFEGLTGSISFSKNMKSKIKLIFKNSISLFGNEDDIITIDMPEFEKYFKLLSENKILAMRIFTPEIMEKIIDILKTNKRKFDINIINDKLYVRVHCTSIFESKIVIGGEKYESLEQEFAALEIMKELIYLIYELIDNLGE
jgi:hypothetical protein